jgi:hypothetical protein
MLRPVKLGARVVFGVCCDLIFPYALQNQIKVPLTLLDNLDDEALLPTCHIFVKTRNPVHNVSAFNT